MVPEKILSRYFENDLDAMELKLTEYIIITISLLYKPKTQVMSDLFRTFLTKFSIFAYISLKVGYFEVGNDYVTDVIIGMLVLILICMERGHPSYTIVPIRFICGFHF